MGMITEITRLGREEEDITGLEEARREIEERHEERRAEKEAAESLKRKWTEEVGLAVSQCKLGGGLVYILDTHIAYISVVFYSLLVVVGSVSFAGYCSPLAWLLVRDSVSSLPLLPK